MLKIVTIIAIAFCLSLANALSFSGNGSGTESDPYQITNVHQLQEMKDDLSAHYILMNDIDASETKLWNNGKGFNSIGTLTYYKPIEGFTGSFDGNNYMISNLYINRPIESNIGLFGCIADGASIRNIKLENAEVVGYDNVGVFIGSIYLCTNTDIVDIYINNCSINGSVFGLLQVGGFWGNKLSEFGKTTVINCNFSGTVEGSGNTGGFFGYNQDKNSKTNIKNCSSYCSVTAKYSSYYVQGSYVGGFAGSIAAAGKVSLLNCFSISNVVGEDNVGGFAGALSSNTDVTKCYSLGTVSGEDYVGGFAGYMGHLKSTISNCYSSCQVSGNNYVGGFTGLCNFADTDSIPMVSNCYSKGSLVGDTKVGGFAGIGSDSSLIKTCYWDIDVSTVFESSGGLGKTTAEMLDQSTYADWDFDTIWHIDKYKNSGYPYFDDLPWGKFGTPVLISLKNNHTTNNLQPDLLWNAVYSAEEYILQISTSDSFSTILVDTILTNVFYTFNKNTEYNTKYYWRVKAQNEEEKSEWSHIWTFEIRDICLPNDYFTGEGNGTTEYPYQITNICQLQEMNNDLLAKYQIMNEIDASDTKYWNEGLGFAPIGLGEGFAGRLDGKNFIIDSLFINRPNEKRVGLFCGILGDAIIENVNIRGAAVKGDDDVGIFAGIIITWNSLNKIEIINCNVNGTVEGDSTTGCFCGVNIAYKGKTIIHNCSAVGDVSASGSSIGGFCGMNGTDNGYAEISKCYSSVNVNGKHRVGGFCGANNAYADKSYITECFANGNVTGKSIVGGFCAENSSNIANAEISNCYSICNITCDSSNSGGFCGINISKDNNSIALIENCYWVGSLIGEANIGGFCGYNNDYKNGNINNCYWNIETSNIYISYGGTPKTTEEMKLIYTFENWDFENIWCIGNRETYPQLQYFTDCDTLVSVPDIQNFNEVEIYPNPAEDELHISLGNISSQPEIEIIDYLGNVIRWTPSARWSPSDKSIKINTSPLSPGVYFLHIRIGEKVEVRKFVVI